MIRKLLQVLALSLVPVFAAADSLVLENVNVVDVEQLQILLDHHVLIRGGRIESVSASPFDGAGLRRMNLAGKFLIPGLIDAHVHLATDPEVDDREALTLDRLEHLLAGGVTSVRDMGGDARVLASLKRRAEIGVIPSPDIYYSAVLAGPMFFKDPRTVSASKGRPAGQADWMRAIHNDTDLNAVVLRAQGAGASGLKVYADVTEQQLGAIVVAARHYDMPVWSHAYHSAVSPSVIAASGVDTMSHAAYIAAEHIPNYHKLHRGGGKGSSSKIAESYDKSLYSKMFRAMRDTDTVLDATLSVFELTKGAGVIREHMYRHAVMFTRMAIEQGVKVAAGTDTISDISGLPFPAVHYEMQLMVEDVGMSPLQALQAATLHGAIALGIDQDYGSVKPGKVANLVILDENPSEQVEYALAITHVLKNGRVVASGRRGQLSLED
jgi:imidazolonepropionase-like amidohydrolase